MENDRFSAQLRAQIKELYAQRQQIITKIETLESALIEYDHIKDHEAKTTASR